MAAPHVLQIVAGRRVNELKQASQSGTRVARVRKFSQMRQSAGNTVLRTASPTVDSKGPKRLSRAAARNIVPAA